MSEISTNYVVISPVRDEEAYIRFTVDCMAHQTIVPKEWVLINDGSSDKTGEILDEYAQRYPWIRVVHRANRGFRKAGGGVVEAFNAGYNALEFRDWDFLVKLDGDLSFEPDYFEKCFQNFEKRAAPGSRRWRDLLRLKRGEGIRTEPHVPCARRHENIQARLLGRHWRLLARSRLGHDGRSKSKHARLDDTEFSGPSYRPFQKDRHCRRPVGWMGQERQGKLHLRLSPALHGFQVHRQTRKKTLSHWRDWFVLRISQRILETDSPSRRPQDDQLSPAPATRAAFGDGDDLAVRELKRFQFFWTI